MDNLFFSAKCTLRRAQHHIADLSDRLKSVTRKHPWTYDIDRDIDGVTEVHKIKISERFSDDIPCIIFDAVNNLRACLDQTSYAACVANGRSDSGFTYFPIVKDVKFLTDKLNGIQGLHPEISSFFEGFNPYKGGNDTLWALNELSNTKKHAKLVPIRIGNIEMSFPAAVGTNTVFFGSTAGTAVVTTPFAILNSVFDAKKNEIILAKLDPDPNRGTNTKITFAIVFDHPCKIINGQNPIFLLDSMRSEVERILLGTEAQCRRIGLPIA